MGMSDCRYNYKEEKKKKHLKQIITIIELGALQVSQSKG